MDKAIIKDFIKEIEAKIATDQRAAARAELMKRFFHRKSLSGTHTDEFEKMEKGIKTIEGKIEDDKEFLNFLKEQL